MIAPSSLQNTTDLIIRAKGGVLRAPDVFNVHGSTLLQLSGEHPQDNTI